MAKQIRIYAPVSNEVKNIIMEMAWATDRSEAYVAEKLIEDGIKFNQLDQYTINPSIDPVIQFNATH